MKNENSVLFKGSKDGIIILLDNDASLDEIKEQLEKKILEAKSFFGDAKLNIFLDGKELTEEEEKEIITLISNKINIEASNIKRLSKKENTKNTGNPRNNIIKETLENGFGEDNTKFYKGTLRSGQKISYNGSVVILGDVNPGAEVTATGNIIVLGALKGIVHAGCAGEKAIVVALKMLPVQLRIADIIGRADDKNINKSEIAEMAYIDENMIYVEPIDQKLFANL